MPRRLGVGWSGRLGWVRRGCRGDLRRARKSANAMHKALLLPNRTVVWNINPSPCKPERGRLMGALGSGRASLPARRLGQADAAGGRHAWFGERGFELGLRNIGEALPARGLLVRDAHLFERWSTAVARGAVLPWLCRVAAALRLLALPV
jgi:hypothetical protein